MARVSHELQPDPPPHEGCRTLQARKRNITLRVEQAVDLRPAGLKELREACLGDLLLLHGFLELPRDNLFDRLHLEFFERTLLLEEVIELASHVGIAFLAHSLATSFIRFFAKSRSACGVFCAFLMNPCR